MTDIVVDEALDGRHARRLRGRTAVIDALFDLLQEEGSIPGADTIARRAGVSVSSIFRYFENLDDLQQHTIERYFERFAPLFEVPGLAEGPLEARIERYVDARTRLYGSIAPIARLARARSLDQPRIAETLHRTRRDLADQVRAHFGPEVGARSPQAGEDLVGSISTLTSFEAWDLLGRELGRTGRQVRRAWTTAIRDLCGPPG